MKPFILFVDDDPFLLQGLKRSLRKMLPLWSMEFVNGAEKAIEICNDKQCDIVITDLMMPNINGIELIKYLNKNFSSIQCVMLSGIADLEDVVELINHAQIARFYTKPCNIEILISGIKKLLSKEPTEPIQLSNEPLMDIYDLTPSEARLACPLLLGKSLEQAAQECNLTLSSARTYLKRIFNKTDTNRQAQLVSKVLLELSKLKSH